MRHGCQTEIVLLCQIQDLAVKAMFDTGCSPGNYMSHAFFHANAGVLQDYLIPCQPERVDLATSNSTQSITQHLVIEARHVDTRGVMRTVKLRFGILEGLRFDVVIGFYAIAMNFMDVMQDLLTIQLEHQESQTHGLAMLYGTTPHLLMINSSPTSEVETDDSRSSTPASIPSVQPLSRDWGHSVQFMLRWPCIYCPEQKAQQTAWEVNHPVGDHDFGDRGDRQY